MWQPLKRVYAAAEKIPTSLLYLDSTHLLMQGRHNAGSDTVAHVPEGVASIPHGGL